MSQKSPSLSDLAKKQLLSRVKAMRQSGPEQETEAFVRPADPHSDLTDFSTLPGYDELRLQRSVAERAGLDNPFFRVHDGRASAHTVIGGQTLINYSSYDYLGLNGHPKVIAAAKGALDRYGVSCSASRLVAGERPAHLSLERALADHYEAEAAIALVSGYMTNVGVIGHLLTSKDLLVMDSQIHNSALVGGLLSTANRRSFPHNNLDALDDLLREQRGKFERCLVVVEGLYSMDGDYPDLQRLVEIKQRHAAWLMVDEAHSLGTLGARGYGLAEHAGVDPKLVDIWMGTLSKTLAGCGGYIAGPAALIDYLKCTAGAFVYSVGMPPVIAASSEAALEVLHDEPERVKRQQENAKSFLELARQRGLDTGSAFGTAVTPILVRDSLPAVALTQRLFERGINVQPIIYPAVPAKESRLRFFITSEHTREDMTATLDVVAEEIGKVSSGRLLAVTLLSGVR